MFLDRAISWFVVSLVVVLTSALAADVGRRVFGELRLLRLDRSESAALVQALFIVTAALFGLVLLLTAIGSLDSLSGNR